MTQTYEYFGIDIIVKWLISIFFFVRESIVFVSEACAPFLSFSFSLVSALLFELCVQCEALSNSVWTTLVTMTTNKYIMRVQSTAARSTQRTYFFFFHYSLLRRTSIFFQLKFMKVASAVCDTLIHCWFRCINSFSVHRASRVSIISLIIIINNFMVDSGQPAFFRRISCCQRERRKVPQMFGFEWVATFIFI